MKTTVLNARQIEQKINRISYEILENNYQSSKLFLVGIKGNGYALAKQLADILSEISEQEIVLAEISIDKHQPLEHPIELSIDINELEGQTVILIDDVINSGRTMQYALMKLLEKPTDRIKTVTLVDRKHRKYPIRVDYVGLTLSTTLQDRIEVELSDDAIAYLV
jgi:pyrimidine operon attenuation protein/uracil phosphoribosyltransferase